MTSLNRKPGKRMEAKLRELLLCEERNAGELSFWHHGYRYARCRGCGWLWQIAYEQELGEDGYECPRCEGIRRKKERVRVRGYEKSGKTDA